MYKLRWSDIHSITATIGLVGDHFVLRFCGFVAISVTFTWTCIPRNYASRVRRSLAVKLNPRLAEAAALSHSMPTDGHFCLQGRLCPRPKAAEIMWFVLTSSIILLPSLQHHANSCIKSARKLRDNTLRAGVVLLREIISQQCLSKQTGAHHKFLSTSYYRTELYICTQKSLFHGLTFLHACEIIYG